MFVNNYNKESKINPLIYKKVNEFNERKKLVKRQKLEKKKLERTKLQWVKDFPILQVKSYLYLSSFNSIHHSHLFIT